MFLVKIAGNNLECIMVQLIKKGGLRERANRSRSYKGSENTETTLKPNRYSQGEKNEEVSTATPPSTPLTDDSVKKD
jgi:hypothetical protein